MEAMVSAFLGLVAGIVGSLVAPWVNWGIEKRKIRYQYRRQVIIGGSNYTASLHFKFSQATKAAWYNSLKLEFPAATKLELEKLEELLTINGECSSLTDEARFIIQNELTALKKKWRII